MSPFVKYSSPSFLSLLPIPFVWGPVGGGESAPMTFWADFSPKNKLYETLRWLWRSIGESDLFTRLTAQRSAIAYATTADTASRVLKLGAECVEIMSGIALSQQDITQLSQCPPPTHSPTRVCQYRSITPLERFSLGIAGICPGKFGRCGILDFRRRSRTRSTSDSSSRTRNRRSRQTLWVKIPTGSADRARKMHGTGTS